MSDIVDQFMSLTLGSFRKIVEERDDLRSEREEMKQALLVAEQERDEAREAARLLFKDGHIPLTEFDSDQLKQRHPWLED